MIKEEIIIEFNELHSSEIIKGREFVAIVKDDNIKKYKIVDTEEELLEYSLKSYGLFRGESRDISHM